MRHRFFDGRANRVQIVGEIARVQVRLHCHHAAADIHSHRCRNDRALRRNHAPHRRADAPVHVRHGGNPFVDERQFRHIHQLLPRLIFELHTLRPCFDGRSIVASEQVVGELGHANSLTEVAGPNQLGGGGGAGSFEIFCPVSTRNSR